MAITASFTVANELALPTPQTNLGDLGRSGSQPQPVGFRIISAWFYPIFLVRSCIPLRDAIFDPEA